MRHDRTTWLVLAFLVVGVLVPTSTVVWFINQTVQRETAAAQQTLTAAYREQLRLIRGRIDAFWAERARVLTQHAQTGAAGFERIVTGGLADSVIVLDESGVPTYPTDGLRLPIVPGPADSLARAAQTDIRVLVAHRNTDAAVAAIEKHFVSGPAVAGRDADGRLIAADELLLAIRLLRASDRRGSTLANRLTTLLKTYDGDMPSAQRRFLMQELAPQRFPTLEAERLAAAFIDSDTVRAVDTGFRRSRLADMWSFVPRDGRVIALYRTASIRSALDQIVTQSSSSVVRFTAIPPGDAVTDDAIAASAALPDWHIAFTITDPRPAQAVARRRIATTAWVGFVAIALIAGVAILLGRSVQRQVRVTRLKTDLVAAVSHELRTPLSSMRLLVDSLLEDSNLDEAKTREYLLLIASENVRLSRVIENFLTFSRIERNCLRLELDTVTPSEIVALVVQTTRDRFPSAPLQFVVETEPDLPPVRGDDHALAMALVNLLDNAYKYTTRDKEIRLRAYREGDAIVFAVQDNGIGIAPREQKRIFRRFYRVDAHATNHHGGSGLGLAIVEFIVRSHGGRVTVESTPGVGSTFKLTLPCDRSAGAAA
jgi:signal transduction histidine kinase